LVNERARLRRLDAALRVAAALLGTAPAAVAGGVGLARFLPWNEGARSTTGLLLVIPLWIGAMCTVFLKPSAARAWLTCAVLTALFSAPLLLVPS
jgi:hypothetical protein